MEIPLNRPEDFELSSDLSSLTFEDGKFEILKNYIYIGIHFNNLRVCSMMPPNPPQGTASIICIWWVHILQKSDKMDDHI